MVRLLLQAAPEAAAATALASPLQLALRGGHVSAARALLGAGSATAVLATLATAGTCALTLFPDFLLAPGRLPLAAADWVLVPSPCPGIERALTASQAAQLVRRLQPANAARLRNAALCLADTACRASWRQIPSGRCV